MTPAQRTALACRLASIAAAGAAIWMGMRHAWVLVGALAWGACFLVFLGGRFQAVHFADRVRHERARRAAHTDPVRLARPFPCCSFWKHSDGTVHGPDCTRPPEARYGTRNGRPLDAEEMAAFDAITSSLDQAGHDPRSAA